MLHIFVYVVRVGIVMLACVICFSSVVASVSCCSVMCRKCGTYVRLICTLVALYHEQTKRQHKTHSSSNDDRRIKTTKRKYEERRVKSNEKKLSRVKRCERDSFCIFSLAFRFRHTVMAATHLWYLSLAADVSHFSPHIYQWRHNRIYRCILLFSVCLPPFLHTHLAIFRYSLHASIGVLNQE